GAAPTGEVAFGEVYKRYGMMLVQQSWLQLLANQQPEETDRERRSTADDVETIFDQASAVNIGRHTVTVTLDRVEQTVASGNGETGGGAQQQATHARALRLVRHQLGRSAKPDVRQLLYLLAAEQQPGTHRIDVLRHNLATGEQAPVKLSERQVE